jgi:hypothetical protein
MLVGTIGFIAAVFVVACSLLGGLALVFGPSHPKQDKKVIKKPLLSNWK